MGEHARGVGLVKGPPRYRDRLLALEVANRDRSNLYRGLWYASDSQNSARGWVLGKVGRESFIQLAVVAGVFDIDLKIDHVIQSKTRPLDLAFYVIERLADLIGKFWWSGPVRETGPLTRNIDVVSRVETGRAQRLIRTRR